MSSLLSSAARDELGRPGPNLLPGYRLCGDQLRSLR
jgi:hypothetical protein